MYDFKTIENKWRKRWMETNIYRTFDKSEKPKYYYLDMFPYPSGELHMGHLRNYIIGDVIARYKKMQGYNVLHPMGWDAFGLPAENAAIERNIHPKEWIDKCISNMRITFEKMGISYDWQREITTCSPTYYKWTQYLFLQFYKAGLAYKKKSKVNWCPSCNTVLANEQVIEGMCERCSTKVIMKELEQWFFKMSSYAERLLEDLEKLTEWPDRVKVMQKNWIGKSEGAEVYFPLTNNHSPITIFTTRPDTLYGATFMAISPEHPIVLELSKNKEVLEFIDRIKNTPELEREIQEVEGVFTGSYAINPLNNEKLPIYVANYVLMEYGTGCIMCVPAHDERDFKFAKKYDLPIKIVIKPPDKELNEKEMQHAYEDEGIMVNSAQFTGLRSDIGKKEIIKYLEQKKLGKFKINYKLRDWCISRQRYWGCPIPIVYCDNCGEVAIPEEDLPVLLPTNIEFKKKGGNPLNNCDEFVNTTCPKCNNKAKRETDTMDTFICSSWYFLRFASPHTSDKPFDNELINYWLPVDQYVGGIEHATMHLIYARFFTKVLYDMGILNFNEPFKRLFTQGMIYKDGAKMSKSKGNVVTPEELIEKYGVDTARLFTLFIGPPQQDAEWHDEGVEGCFRFLNRFYNIATKYTEKLKNLKTEKHYTIDELQGDEKIIYRKVNQTIKKVKEDIEKRFYFHTAIAQIMEVTNLLSNFEVKDDKKRLWLWYYSIKNLTLLLSCFTPYIAEEIWDRVGEEYSVYGQPLPEEDKDALVEEKVTVVIQVNGKLRDKIEVEKDIEEEKLKEIILARDKIKKYVIKDKIKKFIIVKNKLVNIVS